LPLSLQEVKDHLRLSHTTSDEDALLSKYMRAAVSVMNNYVGFPLFATKQFSCLYPDFYPETQLQFFSSYDRSNAKTQDSLLVEMPHVVSNTLQVWYISSGSIFTEVPATDYVFERTTRKITISPRLTWPQVTTDYPLNTVKVTGSFGLAKPPAQAYHGLKELVTKFYENRGDTALVNNLVLSFAQLPDATQLCINALAITYQRRGNYSGE
jgi:hypothetical protein